MNIELLLFFLYPLALISPRLIMPALILHATVIGMSAAEFGRIPLIGMRETLGFLAFAVGVVFVLVAWKRTRGPFSSMTVALVMLLLAARTLSPAAMPGPLPPVLRTIWFELHVILSFVAYSLFAIGALFGILATRPGGAPEEARQYRCLLLGYTLFSIAMIFGGMWAHYAWGSYWLWTPKELWTTIVWLYYSLYLHGRLVRGWSGRIVVGMGIFGFLIVLFTYAGVGLLMKSSHQF
ncbi:MAG TPA: cytochrome c biogenesis protein CcsA [Nitrospirota bacterium]|nr:cytochrome c biogenesis protein CcsA [Nitrospirota bacterium]